MQPSAPITQFIDLSAVLASGLSGALLASQKRFDLGGLAFLTLVAGLGPLPTVVVGVLTAVGGGILRDILAGETPVIFQREVYATAALLGSVLFVGLSRLGAGPETAAVVGFLSAAGLRVVSVWRGWNVPRLGGTA